LHRGLRAGGARARLDPSTFFISSPEV